MEKTFANSNVNDHSSALKELFSQEFSNFLEIIKISADIGNRITKSDFGIICSRNQNKLIILFATENPYFKTGDLVSVDFFFTHNILLNDSKTIVSEAQNLKKANLGKSSLKGTRNFYTSSPLYLFHKFFGYFIFFKNNSYNAKEEILVNNLCSYIGLQIEKLIDKEKNNSILYDFYNEKSLKFNKNFKHPTFYIYTLKEKKYNFPDKNLFNELGYFSYNKDFDIQDIIHPEDLIDLNLRNNNLKFLSVKDIYESNFRIQDSTEKWRFFYQRDIVYSIDNLGNPEEIMSIIYEFNDNETESGQNKFRNYTKDILNIKHKMDMNSEISEILDMTIIQNLKDLGGENDNSFLKEVIELYLEQAPGLLNDISSAANEKNPLKMSQSAHALKGASLNIGAKMFSEVCKALEFKGKENDLIDVDKLLIEMDRVYKITYDELRKLVKNYI